ncbi:MAG: cation-translocating P-type ATPase [Patescibacteria group bacterium]
MNHKGLSSKEAKLRLVKYGPNEIKEGKKVTWYEIFLRQFINIMVLILIIAGGISIFAKEYVDAALILGIVILNAVIGFFQEFKAEKTIEAMKKMTAASALVMRDGKLVKINAKELVPGDIIIIEEGSNIPADAKLIESKEFYSMEASLTGESTPVGKNCEQENMIFLGTRTVKGHGVAIVTATGMNTEFGKIAGLIENQTNGPTPLQTKLNNLSKILAILVIILCAFNFGFGILMKKDLMEMLLLNISLAVGVIPEGLPAVVTLTLAIGVQRLSKQKALVRKLPAAETLGSVSVICTDKTGTLTQNSMTVTKIYTNETEFLLEDGFEKNMPSELTYLLTSGILCNNSGLINGDPTESCLLTIAGKWGVKFEETRKKFPRLDEMIFDSERKRMSTKNKIGNEFFLITKGAPDSILDICDKISINGKEIKLDPAERKKILKINEKYADSALRVLGFAYKRLKEKENGTESEMVFLGLMGMIDPPRPEVKDAVMKCKSAGIDVVMITGDHANTAIAIGKEIGIFQKGDEFLTGAQLDKMTSTALVKIIHKIKIFARVNPSHKVKILEALQKTGKIVSMTGDGVNDAPALQQADIGVAMGITGTDVAKEASDIILIDDNFATIVASVETGRVIYENIKKFVRFLLSANFGELLLISGVFLIGYPIPIIPLQILWINLLTDALPAIALGVDSPDKEIMKRKPRSPNENIFRELLSFSIFTGLLAAIICFLLFLYYYEKYGIEYARTIVFTGIVIFELLLVFSVRYEKRHYFTNFFSNKFLLFSIFFSLLLQIMAIYLPVFQEIFKTVPLNLVDWRNIILATGSGIVIIEIWKLCTSKSK